jgi:RHS repeat-associated protein
LKHDAAGTAYASYQTPAFEVTAGAHALSIVGLNPVGGDHTAFVDDVKVEGAGTAALRWLVADHLGTPRIVVERSGASASVTRHDYLPFGEEIPTALGGRYQPQQGYGAPPDNLRQQFTGYERDAETGLDFAQARYYSGTQGRFTSVDPENVGATKKYPQSWNGYAYVLNGPVNSTDPDGLKFRVCYNGDCHDYSDEQFWDSKKTLQNAGFVVKDGRIFNEAGEQVGTYRRISFDDLNPNANLFVIEMGRRAKATKQLIGAAAATGAVGGIVGGVAMSAAGATFGGEFVTLGRIVISANALPANVVGETMIGWGAGQSTSAVAQTIRLAENLTEQQVKTMIYRGLTKEWVEKQLALYSSAVAQGGAKLLNKQLLPQKELMEKILSLWPK